MTDLVYGGEIGSVVPSDGNVYEETAPTQSGTFDSTRARCGIMIYAANSYAESPTFAAQDDIWFHFRRWCEEGPSSHNVIIASAGVTDYFRILEVTSGANTTTTLQAYVAAVWTTLGSATTAIAAETLQTYDLHIDIANDVCTLYSSGTPVITNSAVVNLAGLGSITKCRWHGCGNPGSRTCMLSEIVISTTTTIGCAVFTQAPTAAGTNTAWTGTYTEVDEIVYSDADSVSTTTNDAIETYTGAALTLGNYVVRGIGVAARGKEGATGPTQIQLAIRTNATNYFSSTQAMDFGYGAHVAVWETSPATAAAWTTANASAAEFGMKAIA
jgi:ketosteroid isomerase-like protein